MTYCYWIHYFKNNNQWRILHTCGKYSDWWRGGGWGCPLYGI